MFVELIDPETRLCSIYGTELRSSKYDSEIKSSKGTRLDYFKGYKLYSIATLTDIIIPLVFNLTIANVYDNQPSDLLYEAKIYNPFLILADVAYDSSEWFKIAYNLEINLLTDINMCKAKSIQLFSMLKGLYNLENSRLYGKAGYERHIKWVFWAYLLNEFNKKQ